MTATPDPSSPPAPTPGGPAPLPGKWNVGRLVRRLSGVDEKLLAWVPQERPRYTGLGGAVLTTSVLAFFSMSFAISQALDITSPWVMLPALVWFVLILNFDRWLVSTPLGPDLRRRLPTLLLRITMAIFFGIVIAEPLVLRVFQTAVEQQVRDDRTQDIADYRSRLETCNPLPPVANPPADCHGFLVPVSKDLQAMRDELQQKSTLAQAQKGEVAAFDTALATMRENERRECAGVSGTGLTGRYGYGPNCRRLKAEADQYEKVHQVPQRHQQLSALDASVVTLTTKISDATTAWGQSRGTYISEQVAERRDHQRGIGLLERMDALRKLSAEHATLGIGIWTVRILFILVDCAPALLKFTGGTTSYDRLYARRLAVGEQNFEAAAGAEADDSRTWSERRRSALAVDDVRHSAGLLTQRDGIVEDLEQRWSRPGSAPSQRP